MDGSAASAFLRPTMKARAIELAIGYKGLGALVRVEVNCSAAIRWFVTYRFRSLLTAE